MMTTTDGDANGDDRDDVARENQKMRREHCYFQQAIIKGSTAVCYNRCCKQGAAHRVVPAALNMFSLLIGVPTF